MIQFCPKPLHEPYDHWNPKETLRIGAGRTLFHSRLIRKVKFGYYSSKKEA